MSSSESGAGRNNKPAYSLTYKSINKKRSSVQERNDINLSRTSESIHVSSIRKWRMKKRNMWHLFVFRPHRAGGKKRPSCSFKTFGFSNIRQCELAATQHLTCSHYFQCSVCREYSSHCHYLEVGLQYETRSSDPQNSIRNMATRQTKCYILSNFLVILLLVKVKCSRYRPGVAHRLVRGIALLFHDRGTRRGWVVSSTLRPQFTPRKDPVPILQEAGWAPGTVCTDGKSRPHRDSIPDPPARSQSLYRLSYSAHCSDSTRNFLSWNPQVSLSAQQYQYRVLGMQSLSSRQKSFIYILILSCHLPLDH